MCCICPYAVCYASAPCHHANFIFVRDAEFCCSIVSCYLSCFCCECTMPMCQWNMIRYSSIHFIVPSLSLVNNVKSDIIQDHNAFMGICDALANGRSGDAYPLFLYAIPPIFFSSIAPPQSPCIHIKWLFHLLR